MSDELINHKINSLEKVSEETKRELTKINTAIQMLSSATERISFTLEKIEKLETDNKSINDSLTRINERISEIEKKIYKFIGGLSAAVFIASILVRFYS